MVELAELITEINAVLLKISGGVDPEFEITIYGDGSGGGQVMNREVITEISYQLVSWASIDQMIPKLQECLYYLVERYASID